jgi:cytochrome c peroxidase
MWDGRKDGLEDQASGPIEAEAEMNLPIPALIERVSGIPSYRRMFHEAFGCNEISKTTITRAIATFERTLVSNKVPFDRWIERR